MCCVVGCVVMCGAVGCVVCCAVGWDVCKVLSVVCRCVGVLCCCVVMRGGMDVYERRDKVRRCVLRVVRQDKCAVCVVMVL